MKRIRFLNSEIWDEESERNQVINSEILNEVVDISFENFHENSLHGSFKYQFDWVLDELQLNQFCHSKQITKNLQAIMIQRQNTWRNFAVVMNGYVFTVNINLFIISFFH